MNACGRSNKGFLQLINYIKESLSKKIAQETLNDSKLEFRCFLSKP